MAVETIAIATPFHAADRETSETFLPKLGDQGVYKPASQTSMLISGRQIDVKMARPTSNEKEGEESLLFESDLALVIGFEPRHIDTLHGFHKAAIGGRAFDIADRFIFFVNGHPNVLRFLLEEVIEEIDWDRFEFHRILLI